MNKNSFLLVACQPHIVREVESTNGWCILEGNVGIHFRCLNYGDYFIRLKRGKKSPEKHEQRNLRNIKRGTLKFCILNISGALHSKDFKSLHPLENEA